MLNLDSFLYFQMNFEDITHLLVYFPIDKSVSVYLKEDVIGWCTERFEDLISRKAVFLEAYFDCEPQKVITYFFL